MVTNLIDTVSSKRLIALIITALLAVAAGYATVMTDSPLLYGAFFVGAVIVVAVLLQLSQHLYLGLIGLVSIGALNDVQQHPEITFLSAVRIVGIVVFFVFAFKLALNSKRLRTDENVLPLSIFVGIFLVSSLLSDSVGSALRGWVSVAFYLAIYLFALNVIDDEDQIRNVNRVLILVSGAIGAFAIAQFITGQTLFPSWVPADPQLQRGGAQALRVLGTAVDPNAGALIPVIGLPIALAARVESRERIWRTIYLIAIVLMGMHLMLSFSRSAWIGAAVGLTAMAILLGYRQVIQLMIAAGVLFLVLNVLPINLPTDALLLRLSNVTEDESRIRLYTGGLEVVADNWLYGVGLTNFRETLEETTGIRKAPHSIPIAIAAQGGVFALLVFVWFLGKLLKRGVTLLADSSRDDSLLMAGLLGAAISWLSMGFFNSYLNWVIGWVVLGQIGAFLYVHAENNPSSYSGPDTVSVPIEPPRHLTKQ